MKKAILKRTADALEKLAIAGMIMGLFHDRGLGIALGIVCIAASYVFTLWEAKK
ncbi:MAG: hypothetical protein LBC10_04445 [Deltaproteobacteria bacterium]|jgi:hypothetical protein|nr:hypothetical protein [Deltaproteobacteria bacterium]